MLLWLLVVVWFVLLFVFDARSICSVVHSPVIVVRMEDNGKIVMRKTQHTSEMNVILYRGWMLKRFHHFINQNKQ